jgi:ATP-dependent helicase/nuclease subunit A
MSEGQWPEDPADLAAEDARGRKTAQREFVRPVVLQAGAGTGKTMALVARVVVWALEPGWARARARLASRSAGSGREPEPDRVAAEVLGRIVAITFTEAAAAEMASRTAEFLAEIVSGRLPKGIDPEALPPDSDARRERARMLLGALDRLVVRTIHAFCRRLLAAYPIEAGVHPGFEVDGDGRATEEVAREVLELRLHEGYGVPGDPVLLELAKRGVGPAALEADLVALLETATAPDDLAHDPFAADRLDAVRRNLVEGLGEFCALARGRFETVKRADSALELVRGAEQALGELARLSGGGVEAMEAVQKALHAAFDDCLDRLEKWSRDDFTKTEREALGQEAAAALARLASELRRPLAALLRLDAPRLDLGRRALAPLLAEGERELRARGILTYDGLLRAARSLLLDHAFVRAKERAQIDQLLVDEFQDTDDVQCRIVEALALEGTEEERPGLFLVGDPKQSIYGWRSADLVAYERFLEHVRALGGTFHRLSVNYRSVRAILDEVERSIRPVMHAQPGLQPHFQPLLSQRDANGERGFGAAGFHTVECWVSRLDPDGENARATKVGDAAELEARTLAQDVARLVREHGVAPSRIGILLRGFGDVEEYLAALREAGVPYAVERDRSYFRRREIIDAAALVRCVIDAGDPLALLSFLRSPVVGVPDAALIPLWSGRLPSLVARLPASSSVRDGIRSLVQRVAAELPADVPGLETLIGWEQSLLFGLEALATLRTSFENDPSDVFVERLRTLLLVEATEAARHLGAFRLANLDRFFRELSEGLSEGADPAAVLRHLRTSVSRRREAEEGRPRTGVENAVRVMSIHKAKGLSFDHVYVMQLHKGRGSQRSEQARTVEHEGRIELFLLGQASPGYSGVEARADEISRHETVRTLYVAMTRARDRLVLAGLWPEADARQPDPASHMALLAHREGGVPDLAAARTALRAEAGADRVVREGVCWVFPALADPLAVPMPARSPATSLLSPAQVETDSRVLTAARTAARSRMQRAMGGPVSRAAHEALRDVFDARREDERAPSAPDSAAETMEDFDARAIAMAVGTAVHRALETLDPMLPAKAAGAQMSETTLRELSAELEGDVLRRALERAERTLARFVSGPLLARLRVLAPHVLGRELPVLLRSTAEGGPIGALAGAIDLVYRDPDTGQPVVVDYKTDVVENDEEIDAKARAYAAQGALYAQALREALALSENPRFELWFLHAGRIEPAP